MNENCFQVDNIDISLGDIEAAALNVCFRSTYTERKQLESFMVMTSLAACQTDPKKK